MNAPATSASAMESAPAFTPRPTPNRSRKFPDHIKIWGIFKPNPNKPNYGLHRRGERWYLLYYDEHRETKMMNLYTSDEAEARFRRDDLYRKAVRLGRGAKSKLQFYAEQILRDASSSHGLKFIVYFGNRKVTCDTLEQARNERAKICKEIIASGQISKRKYLSPIREEGRKV